MTPKWLLACCLLAFMAAGCLVSEQIGEPIGRGRNQKPAEDITIHFDTQVNYVIVFGRSAALAGIAWWIFSSFGAKPGPIIIGGALLAASGWLLATGYATLGGYHLEVAPEGLTLKVPGEVDTLVAWQSIEELELEGFGYARIGGGPQVTPFGARASVLVELPDWKTMKLTLTDGQIHTIVLERLSIEHRQIFAKALIKRGDLVEQ